MILNTAANGGRAGRRARHLEDRLAAAGIEAEIQAPPSRAALRRWVQETPWSDSSTLAIAGGDGTNMVVVDALLSRPGNPPLPKLVLFPAGRGNSVAKDLHCTDLDRTIHALNNPTIRAVDVARYTAGGASGHFLNCLGMGFVTEVDRTATSLRYLGDLSYVLGVLHRTIRLRHHRFHLEMDGHVVDDDLCFIDVMNTTKTGGEMMLAPDAEIDDGLLDVVWVSRINRRSLIGTFPKIFKGTHETNPAVHIRKAASITITSPEPKPLLPDGDRLGSTPVTVSVLPRHIRYLTPA